MIKKTSKWFEDENIQRITVKGRYICVCVCVLIVKIKQYTATTSFTLSQSGNFKFWRNKWTPCKILYNVELTDHKKMQVLQCVFYNTK